MVEHKAMCPKLVKWSRFKLIQTSCICLYSDGTSTSIITMILKLHHFPHPLMSIQEGLRFAFKLFTGTSLYPYGRHHRFLYFSFLEIWREVKRSHQDRLTNSNDNSLRRNIHLISHPYGSVIFKIRRKLAWSVWTIKSSKIK